ncbi:MAG: arsenate reductase ArsC [Planctomycetota bacterium]
MGKPVVLFVCSHNSARSQMAEGLLRHLAGDRFEVASAGVQPGTLNPLSVRAMAEDGIDISSHRAKGVKELLGNIAVHHLIVVCDKAAETCPRVWPGMRERHFWPFDDPSAATGTDEERLAFFCRVRDEIRAKIEHWLRELDQESTGTAASARSVEPTG